jgi:3-dehydroquinate synthase
MNRISVSSERDYEVVIGLPWLPELLKSFVSRERIAIIVSKKMRKDLPVFPSTDAEVFFFEVPDGEEGKSITTLHALWNWLGAAGFTRSDLIVSIGGGATTDLGGFAAATWLRGVEWIAVPTTLAGMVDASVGGKTAVNSDYGKNLIGSFHSPIQVIIDLVWLETLSDRDFSAGLAEVIKTGFIKDNEILDLLEGKELAELRQDSRAVEELISRSVQVKAHVVSGDFKESFERESLNYGHTFGHAIEIAKKFELRHGECVGIGMLFIANLQNILGTIDNDVLQSHVRLLTSMGLPISYELPSWEELYSLMLVDKKSRGKTLRLVTLDGVGKTTRLSDPDIEAMKQAYERVSQ